ncbi:hypothetical protein GWO43_04465 [candidate division KSB1 bacterium]|nr:hypothetical protein [candidate division KSB1 bacterium]NIR71143.1 hypothetical protein [candidate division KSB1 bacterium]NIS23273.1 hypothetical protein [candidate division KSB1 bacterium]NIT70151.1 hypothetical protein [candidate division KSB1 bacterium]NIU23803.1 hypothetical protein [candidate division KSB1 bacterium]
MNLLKGNIAILLLLLWLFANCKHDQIINPETDVVIEQDDPNLKLYPLKNIQEIAEDYTGSAMPFLIQFRVNYNLLDENQIPIIEYDFGEHRNAVTSCITALAFYDEYQSTGGLDFKQGFLNNVEWLVNSIGADGYYHYEFEWWHAPEAVLKKGWVSGMAQGLILAVLARAYQETSDENYLQPAQNVFSTLYTNTTDYWTIYVDSANYYWIEEYPNADSCHVLNGMLYALWGIWDYYVISGDSLALKLLRAGIRTLADHYAIWNIDGQDTSRYCLHYDDPTNYHSIHLEQFEKYANFFNIPEFFEAVRTFSRKN